MNDPLLRELLNVAGDAATLILHAYGAGFEVQYKGAHDPVTSADKAANQLICERLARHFPGVPIVAEESTPDSYAAYQHADRAFFVDPLDGTKEFIAKNDEFVVMIGLAEHGQAVAGVVYAPVGQSAWAGRVGAGAWTVSAAGVTTPIRTSSTAALEQAVLLVSRSHRRSRALKSAECVGVAEIQMLGSAGLKGARVAEGSADIYLSPGMAGKRWDACAIDAIVTAAGGLLTDGTGQRLDYAGELDNSSGLLATNGILHPHVLERLAAVPTHDASA